MSRSSRRMTKIGGARQRLPLSEAKKVPPIGVAIAVTRLFSISAIDGVF